MRRPPAEALLFAVIALGAWACEPGPGPPPLAAGADLDLERRLSELDARYRFLFVDESRVFEARLQSAEETVLVDIGAEERSREVTISGEPELSPDGRWLLVPYFVTALAYHDNRRLLLLDVHSRQVRRVPLLQDEEYGFDALSAANELCDWLAPDRFVISLSHYPEGGGIRKKFYEYDLDDLTTPREVTGFGDVYPVIFRVPGSAQFLWGRSDEPINSWTIHVLDASGFRVATREETAVFDALYLDRPVPNGPRALVVEAHYNAEPLFDFEDTRSHWDIRFGRWLVRRTWSGPSTPTWDEDLQLYTWFEYGEPGTSYLMDAAGRYRPWHRGEWIVKIPRTRPARPPAASTGSP